MNDLSLPPLRPKPNLPRTAVFSLTCCRCGKRQVLASGFIGAAILGDETRVYGAAAESNWQHNPDLCPSCAEASIHDRQ